jgi:hypothetical protein
MRYKILGKHTGWRVSELVLDTGMFGTKWGHGVHRDESQRARWNRAIRLGTDRVDLYWVRHRLSAAIEYVGGHDEDHGREDAAVARQRQPERLRVGISERWSSSLLWFPSEPRGRGAADRGSSSKTIRPLSCPEAPRA